MIVYGCERVDYSYEQAMEILEDLFGKEIVGRYDTRLYVSNVRNEGRRKGKTGGAFYQGNQGEVREEVKNQLRDADYITDRELLVNNLENIAQNDGERSLLNTYRDNIGKLCET